MTDIEERALELLSEVNKEIHGYSGWYEGCNRTNTSPIEALCRAIEQHEAFKQEVSDVASVCAQHFCKQSWTVGDRQDHVAMLTRFIIPAPKPDPLVEVMEKLGWYNAPSDADDLRAALESRGLEIREKNDD